MRRALPAAILLMLAGCASLPVPSPYHALGTEPGWRVDISGSAIRYSGDYGAVVFDDVVTARIDQGPARVVTGQRLSLFVTPGPCSDGMSDRVYPDTVAVVLTAGGRRLSGCGWSGPDTPPNSAP